MDKKQLTAVWVILVLMALIAPIFAWAQEKAEKEVPPGMELLEMGAAKVVVPVGTKVRRIGSLIILEDDGEYMSRRFLEMEERIQELEAKEKELKQEIEALKQTLDKIQTRESIPAAAGQEE
jgi:hypothetical protein